ncbi:hypothetical protein B0I35DRAFT_449344 [Stachybotrys elegans]|uniref:FAD-binding domain-containing protein n=1 Tax=Stachybotrys elegans TaxID=80388 RepID=A0A8K0SX17_9HYPO|nr:hypothetical protein B0I35DRAFT_449344 [Stachybotrys elegans]
MDTLRDEWPFFNRTAVRPLKVIIVGAGIGGLTSGIALAKTGHSVIILESVNEIDEVGAGIQLAPNASRILHRLGVLEEVMGHATVLEKISIRRYSSDAELSTSPLMPSIGRKYGAPMSVIHRGDLQRVLVGAAIKAGCHILTAHTVIAADPDFAATVQVHNNKTGDICSFAGDVVIAADGIKSTIRRQMALSGGYHTAMRYMGPGGHVMGYPLQNNTTYNLVLVHPAKPDRMEDSWTTKGDRQEMLDFYRNWSPAIRRWLNVASQDIMEWTLYLYPPIPRWVKGSTVLVGDACHPMLPFVAQGAANAIEGAAVLATAFTCTADIPLALMMYEKIRKERGEKIAASASDTALALHLPNGPAQRRRDEAIVNRVQSPDKWNNTQWQDYMWGVDVMDETMKLWRGVLSGHM